MKHRNSHFAVGYWNRIRAGNGVPDQADIDPKALKRCHERYLSEGVFPPGKGGRKFRDRFTRV